MTILYAATSLSDCTTRDKVNTVVSTTAAKLGPYVPEGCQMNYTNDSGDADTPDLTFDVPAMTEGWVSFYLDFSDFTGNNWGHNIFAFRNQVNSLIPLFRIYKVINSFNIRLFYAQGSSESYINLTPPSINLHRFDINFKIDATAGFINIYMDGIIWTSYTGPLYTISSGPMNRITFQREGGNSSIVRTMSALFMADEDTRTMHLTMDYPTANGTYGEWTGDYASVNGQGIDDTDYIFTNLTGKKESFTFPAVNTSLSLFEIKAAILSASSNFPTRGVKGFTRVGSTNYDNGQFIFKGDAGKGKNSIFNTNPATGLAWTLAELEAAEFGLESTE